MLEPSESMEFKFTLKLQVPHQVLILFSALFSAETPLKVMKSIEKTS